MPTTFRQLVETLQNDTSAFQLMNQVPELKEGLIDLYNTINHFDERVSALEKEKGK